MYNLLLKPKIIFVFLTYCQKVVFEYRDAKICSERIKVVKRLKTKEVCFFQKKTYLPKWKGFSKWKGRLFF
jgi:hypothetical protein